MAEKRRAYPKNTVSKSKYGSSSRPPQKVQHSTKQSGKNGGLLSSILKKQQELDFTFLTLVIVIICFGIIMVFSASAPKSLRMYGNSYNFVKKQLIFAVLGFVGMIALSKVEYQRLKKYTRIIMIGCIVLMALVFIPGLGVEHNGARRWLNFGIEIQPSEFMKPAIALFIAGEIDARRYNPRKLLETFKVFIWIGVVAILMFLQPHVSGAVVICGIAGVVMICSGINLKHLFGCAGAVLPFGVLYVAMDSVRRTRVLTALNPFADSQNAGYQVIQGLYAIASGGIFGRGLGQSIQKRTFLPEPYNDYIFAVICEELGLIGAIMVIVLFAVLIIRGISIALNAPDLFGTLIVVGFMAQISIQTILNILVVTAVIPNTGMTLPFFSYGGSALLVLMLEMGVVLNVSRQRIRNRV